MRPCPRSFGDWICRHHITPRRFLCPVYSHENTPGGHPRVSWEGNQIGHALAGNPLIRDWMSPEWPDGHVWRTSRNSLRRRLPGGPGESPLPNYDRGGREFDVPAIFIRFELRAIQKAFRFPLSIWASKFILRNNRCPRYPQGCRKWGGSNLTGKQVTCR